MPWFPAGDRLNPQTGVILNGYSEVNSWYHGLVLTWRKPMSHGFEALINYTFSKSIDDGAVAGSNGTFYGTDYTLNPYNQKQENSLSDLDQRHRLVASLMYSPQVFHKLTNKVAKNILDGFNFAGSIRRRAASRVSYTPATSSTDSRAAASTAASLAEKSLTPAPAPADVRRSMAATSMLATRSTTPTSASCAISR